MYKVYYYLSNYLYLQDKNLIFINIVNYLGNLCLYITQINYNLGTTYATNNNYCQDVLLIISTITILTSFEDINNLIKNIQFVISYFKDDIGLTLNELTINCDTIKKSLNTSTLIKDEYKLIYDQILKYELNFLIIEQLSLDIDNLWGL